ncbi:MAG: serine/threonine protein kinase [Planctomycetota bacterium]|nr:MAG: serine/threonine protein kinase [Planctomycetota bacterium]REJ95425.1 MAG: serine/threonine protein kinase [Planctomycetota bacterium]
MTDARSEPQAAAPVVDLTGRTLGDYQLLRRLGRGAMAEVYLARQSSLDRQVAFKVLRPDLARDETYLRRFEMEARAAAALVHASIVQIYEVGCLDDLHFIAQEYVAGQNLAERLRSGGPPPLAEAVNIMSQVAAALAKAAEHGIVHRDIKPDNLMLADNGEVKVADFGLARVSGDREQQRITQVGITMGSPLYMSPEQAEGRPLDTRSDIYSFGATCFEMFAGQPPFDGETALSVAVQHVKSQPPQLAALRPDLPTALCELVHRMLAKQPEDRFANGAALLAELRQLPLAEATSAVPPVVPPAGPSWDTAPPPLAGPQHAATQHLARVMGNGPSAAPAANSTIPWRNPLVWIGGLVALVLGGWLAWPTAEAPLLQVTEVANGLPQKLDDPRQQYLFALELGTEAAMQSVEAYFPDDERHVTLARKQLATRYLEEERHAEALTLFAQFADAGELNPDLYAYGLAGQYVVRTLRDESEAAAASFTKLTAQRGDGSALFDRLRRFDPVMARRVAQVRAIDRRGSRGEPTELDRRFEQLLREGGERGE